MQLRHLKTFAAVASTLNITRAAEQVHLAQSSVTEQIQALEAELGAALFDRSRRRLLLTPAGARLLDYAAGLLALADEARAAVADAAGVASGMLVAGGLETLCAKTLPGLLASFRAAHPAIGVRMKVAGSGELRNAVKSGDADVCFVFGDAPEPDLHGEILARENLVVIAPPNHRLAGGAVATRQDLAGESFLVTEAGCVYRRMFEDAFPPADPARPRLAGEFGSIAAIASLVEAGLGCALLPRLAVADGAAVAILPAVLPGTDTVPVSMLWRRRRVQKPALKLFLDAARQSFGAATPDGVRLPRAAPCR